MQQCFIFCIQRKGLGEEKYKECKVWEASQAWTPPYPFHPICINNHISAWPHSFIRHAATSNYSRTAVTQTLKENQKGIKLAGNASYWGKFQCNFDPHLSSIFCHC